MHRSNRRCSPCTTSRVAYTRRVNRCCTRTHVDALSGVSLALQAGRSLGVVRRIGLRASRRWRASRWRWSAEHGPRRVHGRDLNALPERELREARRDFQMVFQDPYGSLDLIRARRSAASSPSRCNQDGVGQARARGVRGARSRRPARASDAAITRTNSPEAVGASVSRIAVCADHAAAAIVADAGQRARRLGAGAGAQSARAAAALRRDLPADQPPTSRWSTTCDEGGDGTAASSERGETAAMLPRPAASDHAPPHRRARGRTGAGLRFTVTAVRQRDEPDEPSFDDPRPPACSAAAHCSPRSPPPPRPRSRKGRRRARHVSSLRRDWDPPWPRPPRSARWCNQSVLEGLTKISGRHGEPAAGRAGASTPTARSTASS